MSKHLDDIMKKNAQWEKETPYNFCDRWCARCPVDKQTRCTVYLNETEQQITCIAHGREDDPEMTEAVISAQYDGLDEKLQEMTEEFDIDPDESSKENDDWEKRMRTAGNDPLTKTAKNYFLYANAFLEKATAQQQFSDPKLEELFHIIGWYHTILPVKLARALSGIPDESQESFGLHDAVAQLQICKKAANLSIQAWHEIAEATPEFRTDISRLTALLHNMLSRIKLLEESI